MYWKHRAALCAVLSVMALGTLVTALAVGTPGAPEAEPPSAAEVMYEEPEQAERSYVLRPLDGRVAVYLEGMASPLLVTDIDLKTLREVDRKLIETGLVAGGQSELMELLEDLGS